MRDPFFRLIVGRARCGKSTLLEVLCRRTKAKNPKEKIIVVTPQNIREGEYLFCDEIIQPTVQNQEKIISTFLDKRRKNIHHNATVIFDDFLSNPDKINDPKGKFVNQLAVDRGHTGTDYYFVFHQFRLVPSRVLAAADGAYLGKSCDSGNWEYTKRPNMMTDEELEIYQNHLIPWVASKKFDSREDLLKEFIKTARIINSSNHNFQRGNLFGNSKKPNFMFCNWR